MGWKTTCLMIKKATFLHFRLSVRPFSGNLSYGNSGKYRIRFRAADIFGFSHLKSFLKMGIIPQDEVMSGRQNRRSIMTS